MFKSIFRFSIGTGAFWLETNPFFTNKRAFNLGFKFFNSLNLPFKLKNKSLFPSILVSFAQSKYCGGKTEIMSLIVVFSEAALMSIL